MAITNRSCAATSPITQELQEILDIDLAIEIDVAGTEWGTGILTRSPVSEQRQQIKYIHPSRPINV